MASPQSLRRIARLAQQLEAEMKAGGMGYPWKSLFRTNAILTRIVAHFAEHLAQEAEGQRPAQPPVDAHAVPDAGGRRRPRVGGPGRDSASHGGHSAANRPRSRADDCALPHVVRIGVDDGRGPGPRGPRG